MSEISKHFDLYQFFVYLLPGIFFVLVIYFLFLFEILDINTYMDSINLSLIPPYEGNSILFSVLGLIIAYFVGHILHMIGLFIFSYNKLFRKIKKRSDWIFKRFGYEKTKKELAEEELEKSDEQKIKEYVEKQFRFHEEELKKPDFMLTYLFLEDFVQSKKIKLMQVLLGLYKSLFAISLFLTVIFIVNKNRLISIIIIIITIMIFKQARNYYKSGSNYGYNLAYLYFKDLKK